MLNDINTMLCPIKTNSNTIEHSVHTSCFQVLDLLCVNKDIIFSLAKDFFTRKVAFVNCFFMCKSFYWIGHCSKLKWSPSKVNMPLKKNTTAVDGFLRSNAIVFNELLFS